MNSMKNAQPMFSASIPADYDKYLGPFLFDFYARISPIGWRS